MSAILAACCCDGTVSSCAEVLCANCPDLLLVTASVEMLQVTTFGQCVPVARCGPTRIRSVLERTFPCAWDRIPQPAFITIASGGCAGLFGLVDCVDQDPETFEPVDPYWRAQASWGVIDYDHEANPFLNPAAFAEYHKPITSINSCPTGEGWALKQSGITGGGALCPGSVDPCEFECLPGVVCQGGCIVANITGFRVEAAA